MWDEHTDVAVVGSGFAGLAAALEADAAGATVQLLEKAPSLGGNSKMSGGGIAAVGSQKQAEQGIEDSVDLFVEDLLEAGGRLNHPDLVRFVGEHSWPTVRWLQEEIGVEFKSKVSARGGHSVPRSYTAKGTIGGAQATAKLIDSVEATGIDVRTGRKLTDVYTDEGRVVGIEALDHDPIRETKEGTNSIRVTGGVVLAAGGFGNDQQLKASQQPPLRDASRTTNHPWATGEVLRMALELGANPIHLSYIQLLPTTCPEDTAGGTGLGNSFGHRTAPYGIWIDPTTGRRFVNELADRRTRALAEQQLGTDPEYPLALVDAAIEAAFDELEAAISSGFVYRFDTVEAFAEQFGVPVDPLRDEIATYNSYLKRGEDPDFGKPIQDDATPLDSPPWYAMRLWPRTHYTMGGVQINTDAAVIDTAGDPIPGLYAAGEVTGGVHGRSRLTSCSIPECLCFGRVAGAHAAGGQSPYDVEAASDGGTATDATGR